MAEMRAAGMVLGDIREMREIVGVLAGAVNVPNLVLANRLISHRVQESNTAIRNRQSDVGCDPRLATRLLQLLYGLLGGLGATQLLHHGGAQILRDFQTERNTPSVGDVRDAAGD